ncbi:MAG: PAS domain S-box protein [Chloroflexota bacterium]
MRILLLDEAPGMGAQVADWLLPDVPQVEVRQVTGEADLCGQIAHSSFDLVITESCLSWASGLDVVRLVRSTCPECPVIVLTAEGDEDLAVASFQAGCDGYLRKARASGGGLTAAVRAARTAAQARADARCAQQALLERDARHRVIVETASDAIITIDERGNIESANPAVYHVFGYRPDELLGRNVAMLMPGAVAAQHDGYLTTYVESDQSRIIGIGRVVEGRRKDGTICQLDLAISEVRLAGNRRFTGMVRDIGERLRAEEERLLLLEREQAAVAELQREATEKTLILDNMLDGVVVTDRQGRYTMVNGAAARLLGMAPADMIGVVPSNLPWESLDEYGRVVRLEDRPITRALGGEPASMVQRVRTVDGREIVVRASSAPVRNDRGDIIGAVHVMHDMTEEYARARQAAQGAKLRSLGQLASGVAHDLNQFLGLVVGYGDLAIEAMERQPADLDSVRESLDMMLRAAINGSEVVRRLLLFARPGVEGPATRVDLDDLLREVAKLTAPRWRDAALQHSRPIAVDLEIEGEVSIDGWASDLREAFTNLVLNAIDALPNGGRISLVTRAVGDQVLIEVRDDGIGMTAETRDRLFEPFFSTKGEGGSGLGLAIVFGIVERHRGAITVESAPGQGTAFRMTFPAATTTSEVTDQFVADDRQGRSLKVLVVDDEPSLGTMLSRILASDGHQATVALSGEEALSLLTDGHVAPFDVVISDLGMGSGMSGWDLAAAVGRLPQRPHFILSTGWGADIDEAEAAARGVHYVLAKPYRLPDLRRVLATF